MLLIYPFIIAFILVFVSELGDKTQLLALSFSSKINTSIILIGVAVGSLFSHGIAIIFGSFLGEINNFYFQKILKIITCFSFILFGIITLKSNPNEYNSKSNSKKQLHSNIGYILFIALSIAINEIGDKTFLASIGLGIQYPSYKLMLVLGAILGMVISDLIAVIFGKVLAKKFSDDIIQKFSGILFLIFGFIGLLNYAYNF